MGERTRASGTNNATELAQSRTATGRGLGLHGNFALVQNFQWPLKDHRGEDLRYLSDLKGLLMVLLLVYEELPQSTSTVLTSLCRTPELIIGTPSKKSKIRGPQGQEPSRMGQVTTLSEWIWYTLLMKSILTFVQNYVFCQMVLMTWAQHPNVGLPW